MISQLVNLLVQDTKITSAFICIPHIEVNAFLLISIRHCTSASWNLLISLNIRGPLPQAHPNILVSIMLPLSSLLLALLIPLSTTAHALPDSFPAPHTKLKRQNSSAAAEAQAAAAAAQAQIVNDNLRGISSGALNPNAVDPCGPPNSLTPGPPGSFKTCHRNVSTKYATSGNALAANTAYGVNCLNDGTGYTLDQDTCADSVGAICLQISGIWGTKYQTPNQWIWSTENGNCTFGYWLPANGAPPPSDERCREGIIGVMNDACRGPEYNAASVNLVQLPWSNASGSGTGQAVDAGYPSYVMVAQQSYTGVNKEDIS